MIPLSNVPYLVELKKTQEILLDDAKYNSVSQCLHTNEEALQKSKSFQNKIEDYYESLEILRGNNPIKHLFRRKIGESALIKLVKKNSYYLYDDFSIFPDFLKKKEKEGLISLIYSPFSINFFSRSFKSIFNEYFTGKPIPQEIEELNSITYPIGNNLLLNMKYCPKFIKELFQKGYEIGKKKILPTEIFENFVIEEIFKNPYLFGILDFNQKYNANIDDLNRLKDSIKGQFKIEGFFIEKPLTVLSSEMKLDNNFKKTSFSPLLLINLRDLLKKGKIIPDQISSEFSKLPLTEQVKELLVTENDTQQEQLFEKIEIHLKKGQKIMNFLLSGLKIIQFEAKLSELADLINGTLFNLKCFCITFQNPNLMNINIESYIQNPSLFLNDITEEFEREQIGPDEPGDDNGDEGENNDHDILQQSTLVAAKSDPVFLNIVMLHGLTLKKFIQKRPSLRMADYSFRNQTEQFNQLSEVHFDPLIDMMKNDHIRFKKMASDFSSSFSDSKDPYNLLRDISKAYTFALTEMKMFMNQNADDISKIKLSKDDENKFIISLFSLVSPPNVFSTFVYLYEFLLSPLYKKEIFYNTPMKHFNVTEKILKNFIFYFNNSENDLFNIAEYCLICQKKVNLVIENNKDVLDKLAKVVSRGDTKYEKILMDTFQLFGAKSVLKSGGCKFTFRVFAKGDFADIFVCNVTELADHDFDKIPLDKYKDLVAFLNRKYNSECYKQDVY